MIRTNSIKRLSSRTRRHSLRWKKESAFFLCLIALLWAYQVASWRPASDHAAKVSSSASPSIQHNTEMGDLESRIPSIVRERCNLQQEESWMPPPNDWTRRVPAFLVLGAKKCGTTGLFQTLEMHPRIVRGRTKELQFFVPKRFQSSFVEDDNRTIRVHDARDALFSRQFPTPLLQNNTQLITGEATPDYFMFPDLAGMAILCTIPWAKFVVVLRDPIERLYSHYNYLSPKGHGKTAGHRKKMATFEDWIRNDIRILQNVGVLPQNLSQVPSYMGSQEEREGWLRYQSMLKPGAANPGSDRHFVRSLYAPQLEQWMHLMRQFGKDPKKDLRVIFSKDLKRNSKVINELFQWLGLPAIPNINVKQSMITQYFSPPMSSQLKNFLKETIFDHFNARLFQLLSIKPVF